MVNGYKHHNAMFYENQCYSVISPQSLMRELLKRICIFHCNIVLIFSFYLLKGGDVMMYYVLHYFQHFEIDLNIIVNTEFGTN